LQNTTPRLLSIMKRPHSTIAKPPSTTEAGSVEKGAYHAQVALGHAAHAWNYQEEAAKAHAELHASSKK
jgi:hypothetical protein